MKSKILRATFSLVLIGTMLVIAQCGVDVGPLEISRFSSYEELKGFVEANTIYRGMLETPGDFWGGVPEGGAEGEASAPSNSGYSTTNIQVTGVDEADIVKTDGEYIYLVSENSTIIVKAYPPEQAHMLSKIELDETYSTQIYVNDNRLVVLGSLSPFLQYGFAEITSDGLWINPSVYNEEVFLRVYDITDRSAPILSRTVLLNGTLSGSRMIGNYVYATVNQLAVHPNTNKTHLEVTLPKISTADAIKEIQATEIRYINVPDAFYYFTTVIAVNIIDDAQEPTHETFLTGSTACMYVSQNNMYLTVPNTNVWILSAGISKTRDETLIYRVKLDGEEVTCEAEGAVSGYDLNEFSMDEYNGSFRIATTKWTEGDSKNNLYILDTNLDIVGKLEDLAPGEQIYSARFMGVRCYLVTFRQIDPFFVIDLSSTAEPEVLGYLKIPGYSSYLHPYDDDHIIGIGKQDSNVKLSLFNVTDVTQPTETAKYIVPTEWSDSPVLTDHKAFLFDKSRQLLVLPVSMNWYHTERFSQDLHAWQGAYVFNITLSDGFVVRGNVTHQESESNGWDSNYSVNRALYIESTLYTVSNKRVKMNDLETLQETNDVELS